MKKKNTDPERYALLFTRLFCLQWDFFIFSSSSGHTGTGLGVMFDLLLMHPCISQPGGRWRYIPTDLFFTTYFSLCMLVLFRILLDMFATLI